MIFEGHVRGMFAATSSLQHKKLIMAIRCAGLRKRGNGMVAVVWKTMLINARKAHTHGRYVMTRKLTWNYRLKMLKKANVPNSTDVYGMRGGHG